MYNKGTAAASTGFSATTYWCNRETT